MRDARQCSGVAGCHASHNRAILETTRKMARMGHYRRSPGARSLPSSSLAIPDGRSALSRSQKPIVTSDVKIGQAYTGIVIMAAHSGKAITRKPRVPNSKDENIPQKARD